jgi:hypothetical protein
MNWTLVPWHPPLFYLRAQVDTGCLLVDLLTLDQYIDPVLRGKQPCASPAGTGPKSRNADPVLSHSILSHQSLIRDTIAPANAIEFVALAHGELCRIQAGADFGPVTLWDPAAKDKAGSRPSVMATMRALCAPQPTHNGTLLNAVSRPRIEWQELEVRQCRAGREFEPAPCRSACAMLASLSTNAPAQNASAAKTRDGDMLAGKSEKFALDDTADATPESGNQLHALSSRGQLTGLQPRPAYPPPNARFADRRMRRARHARNARSIRRVRRGRGSPCWVRCAPCRASSAS